VNDDDRRLIADCLGGRREAFGHLVTRYQTRLYNAALRLVQSPDDAADVVQDAFLNAFQSLHTFKGDAEFFTWLYRIAFNTAISFKRKKRPAVSLEAHAGEAGIDPDDPSEYVKPGSALERTEDERQLSDAIARLSPEHREVLLLKDLEGFKYEDIAVVLGVPIGTIRSRLHRARLELRELLAPFEEYRPRSDAPAEDVTEKNSEEAANQEQSGAGPAGERPAPPHEATPDGPDGQHERQTVQKPPPEQGLGAEELSTRPTTTPPRRLRRVE
jgi:RNA polymerase sigma-70 factor (ECF subfamily)